MLYLFPPVPVAWTLLDEEHTKKWRIAGGIISEDGKIVLPGPHRPSEFEGGEFQGRAMCVRKAVRGVTDIAPSWSLAVSIPDPVTAENYKPTSRR
jgi:hypothetical protein